MLLYYICYKYLTFDHLNVYPIIRMYKNGNNNIRTLLYNLEMNKVNKFRSTRFYNCIAKECSHPNIRKINKPSLKYIAFYTSDYIRYPFAFVRDPLTRFISAVTEVDFVLDL